MKGKELELVEWLGRQSATGSCAKLGIGDDMAILETPSGVVLTSSDMLLDGVHFDTSREDFALIGRKAVACNFSDCAAMAVRPLAITASVAWCAEFRLDDAKRVLEGMREIAAEYDTDFAGGDTAIWDKPMAIDVAIIAVPYGGIAPVRRGGARVGDILYVTGPLGGSKLGRHLTFTPRVREAKLLAGALGRRLHAMIDLSDGLSLDVSRVCEASGAGAVLDEEKLRAIISEDARAMAEGDGRSPMDHALSDGEDFELLFAAEGEVEVAGVDVFPVGEIADKGLWVRRVDGRLEPLEPRGYVH